jgi:hypothetical protein
VPGGGVFEGFCVKMGVAVFLRGFV